MRYISPRVPSSSLDMAFATSTIPGLRVPLRCFLPHDDDASSDDGDQLRTPDTDESPLVHLYGVDYAIHGQLQERCHSPLDMDDVDSALQAAVGSPFPSPFASSNNSFDASFSKSVSDSTSRPSDSAPPLTNTQKRTTFLPTAEVSATPDLSLSQKEHRVPSSLKRHPSHQSPIPYPKRKPKLSRACLSEYLPTTLASAYSRRFPPSHRLHPDFVQSYALDAELGSGGYGFVMTAKHRSSGFEVAVKFILKAKMPKHAWSVDDSGRPVPIEAKLLSVLQHPGIVKLYGLYEDELYFYLVS